MWGASLPTFLKAFPGLRGRPDLKNAPEQIWPDCLHVAGFLEVFYIENKLFALDTLRVANRSPTPASKINDFPGLFDDIWGVRGRLSRPDSR